MASDELLSRLDRHIERGTELMELNREAFDRNSEVLDRVIVTLDRTNETIESQREFIREQTLRSERVHSDLIAEIHQGFTEVHEGFADQRRALLAILDRLPPGRG